MNTTCVVCQRRETDTPQVCATCHSKIDTALEEIPALLAEATDLTDAPDGRKQWRIIGAHLGCAQRVLGPALDPVNVVTRSGPTGTPGRTRVAGTREAPLPVSLDLLDLIGPGSASVTDPHGDQDGHLPPGTWLTEVCADWETMRGFAPPSTIAGQIWYLRHWLPLACREHPAIADFAMELRQQVGRLRAAAGVTPERPELCSGVACQHCDARNLWRLEGRVHCGSCGKIYEQDEYDGWVREQATKARKVAA